MSCLLFFEKSRFCVALVPIDLVPSFNHCRVVSGFCCFSRVTGSIRLSCVFHRRRSSPPVASQRALGIPLCVPLTRIRALERWMAEMRVPFVCSAETWRKRGENRKNGKNPCSSKKLLYPGHSMPYLHWGCLLYTSPSPRDA